MAVRSFLFVLSAVGVICAVLAVGAGPASHARAGDFDRRALERIESPPLGLPPVPIPADNPPTADKIALGRKLFFDRRLSFNKTMSCGMCHVPEQGFTNNELATPIGVEGRSLRRNAPTVLNAAYLREVFLDGREHSLETQALNPLVDRSEMANPSLGWVVRTIRELPDYDGLFEKAFGGGPTVDRIGMAVASWERSLVSGNSPFDRWHFGGEKGALTERQIAGFELFTGKAGCVTCHRIEESSARFTDDLFHNTGIQLRTTRRQQSDSVRVEIAPGVYQMFPRSLIRSIGDPRQPDLGRFEITLDPGDKWRYRTPSLRNVAITGPYMHDGSLESLEEVVQFYVQGGVPHDELDPLIRPIDLDPSEQAAIVAFLQSLSGSDLDLLQADARSAPIGDHQAQKEPE